MDIDASDHASMPESEEDDNRSVLVSTSVRFMILN